MSKKNVSRVYSSDSCKCDNIPGHRMCMLSRPAGNFDIEKVKKLSKNPKYICSCCGRAARDNDRLCSPVKLKE
ncbi:MAG: hypothetical protein PF545_03235 [Elusimicrobia bacterium]|nr:hypothetical protein [Elusimicrobiota bacterium]